MLLLSKTIFKKQQNTIRRDGFDQTFIETSLLQQVKLRSANWWGEYFDHLSLEENEDMTKKFEQASERMSHIPLCQIFHLKPYN